MLRIDRWKEGARTVVKLQGRLGGELVAVLENELAAAGPANGVILDLGGLGHADPSGLEVLRAAIRGGAQVRSVTGFVASLLGPG